MGRGAERSGGLNPRQRQVEWVLGARRRQVERELAGQAFAELASVGVGEQTGATIYGIAVRLIAGTAPLLGFRIGSPALPTASVFIAGGVVTEKTIEGKLTELYDESRRAGPPTAAPDAPQAYLATEAAFRLLEKMIRGKDERFGPVRGTGAWSLPVRPDASSPGPLVD